MQINVVVAFERTSKGGSHGCLILVVFLNISHMPERSKKKRQPDIFNCITQIGCMHDGELLERFPTAFLHCGKAGISMGTLHQLFALRISCLFFSLTKCINMASSSLQGLWLMLKPISCLEDLSLHFFLWAIELHGFKLFILIKCMQTSTSVSSYMFLMATNKESACVKINYSRILLP